MKYCVNNILYVGFFLFLFANYGCKSNSDESKKIADLQNRVSVLETKVTKLDSAIMVKDLNKPAKVESISKITCTTCNGSGLCRLCYGSKIKGGEACTRCDFNPHDGVIEPTGFCETCKGAKYIIKNN